MSDLSQYFLNSSSSIVQLELVEISHPNFTQTYRLVRNAIAGVDATIDGIVRHFDYYPLKITPNLDQMNLDHGINLQFGDLGEILPKELDAIFNAGSFGTKPQVRYWTFRSDNLVTPLVGPIVLEMDSIAFTKTGATFEAKASPLNILATGEVYTFDRFPMLKGFL